jgi:hypothetical protein
MRPLVLLACAAAGVLGGGALIGMAALGGCLIFVSVAAVVLLHDFPEPGARRPRPGVRSVEEFLREKAAEHW